MSAPRPSQVNLGGEISRRFRFCRAGPSAGLFSWPWPTFRASSALRMISARSRSPALAPEGAIVGHLSNSTGYSISNARKHSGLVAARQTISSPRATARAAALTRVAWAARTTISLRTKSRARSGDKPARKCCSRGTGQVKMRIVRAELGPRHRLREHILFRQPAVMRWEAGSKASFPRNEGEVNWRRNLVKFSNWVIL
jgi:hypothetical protein